MRNNREGEHTFRKLLKGNSKWSDPIAATYRKNTQLLTCEDNAWRRNE